MKPLRVGLTGGIATGKSTVLAEFKRLGAATVSMDELAHQLLREPAVAARVRRRFGTTDRKALGRIVFHDKAKLRALERLLHPLIRRRADRVLARSRKPVRVADVPLLFEKGLAGAYDVTLTVFARPEQQERRLASRDGMSRAEARMRIGLQTPIEKKARLADVVIDNSGPVSRTRKAAREYYRAFELLSQ